LLDEQRFALCFALSRLTPGTNVLAFCTAVGWLLRRLTGAVVALLAASLPSAALVMVATICIESWRSQPLAQAAIHGAVAAAIGLTLKTAWVIVKPQVKTNGWGRVLPVGLAAFGLHVFAGLPAIYVLLLAGVCGAFFPDSNSSNA
jgi:chromate transporter